MKVALVGMISNVSTSLTHHGGGYANIMVSIIKDYVGPDVEVTVNPDPKDWNSFDELMVLEGVNFQGKPAMQIGDQIIRIADKISYNMPGGPQEIHTQKMQALANFDRSKKVWLINNLFDFSEFNKRIKIDYKDWPQGTYIDVATDYGKKTRKCVIGDSHSLSVWKTGFGLDRTDGKTLWNFVNTSRPEDINRLYDETITYFGSIDLRFHLMRQPNPEQAARDLFNRYLEFSSRLTNNTVVGPLPIEHESRKLPGTGLYKGQPFFGTREERMRLREIALEVLKSSGSKLILWPEEWGEGDGTKMFEYMEPRQSVHLKPIHYYFDDVKQKA
jgi:hypothetical protein